MFSDCLDKLKNKKKTDSNDKDIYDPFLKKEKRKVYMVLARMKMHALILISFNLLRKYVFLLKKIASFSLIV